MATNAVHDVNSEAGESDPLLSREPDHGDGGEFNGSRAPNAERQAAIAEPSNGELSLILGSLWVGVVFTALDSTIVATLLVPISSTFSSLDALSWIGSAYLIASAATQPLAGRLTDIFGRREGAVACNMVFAIGTLICGCAQTQWVLISGRVVAGMGGGALNTISTVVGSDLVPLRKRGGVQGINNIAMGAFGAMGGLFGGLMNDLLGWNWAFLIQVPFILLGALLCFFIVKVPLEKSPKSRIKRVDWLGSFTLVCGLVLLMFGLTAGGNLVAWNHPLVLATLISSVGIFGLFVFIEARVPEPIVPVRLFFVRTITAANSTYLFAYMSYFAMVFFVPIYLQVLGNSPTQAGLRFVPHSVGTAIGAMSAGIVIRATGSYTYLNFGIHATLIASSAAMAFLDLHSPPWLPFLYLGLAGLGFGGMLVATLIALISSAEQSHQASLTASSFVFRSTGSTLGVTVCSALFQNSLRSALWKSLGNLDDAGKVIGRLLKNFDEISSIDRAWVTAVRLSYIEALHGVFCLLTAFSVLAGLSAITMRQNVLHMNLSRRN